MPNLWEEIMTETKRDVVEAILLVKDTDTIWDSSTVRYYLNRYDAALPDDLPTIPLATSEHIRKDYGKTTLFDELAWAFQDSFDSSEVNEWITNNEDIFAEAWSRGLWIVKETGEVTGYDD
ncbi:hypothetical protein lb338_phage_37 [Lactobacillus phage Lb338-1]|uniref:Uncharacterized protein n=1 Tax=Lactobacillus phage Lb338-1 TaxID=2892342 RepID=C1KFE7_9CAUD|nr:hypothetical protein lb338_phage_37 [Lactobacillus phage Lb338-1]ACO36958.1 hypothetical protein lb338_phage_37 [Lactobacillus phage Lb338-1]